MSIPNVKRRVDTHAHHRRRVVTVIGSGRDADPCCEEVGRLIATLGCDLLTGGGCGVMEAVSRAFYETTPRRGLVIGVVPGTVRDTFKRAPAAMPARERVSATRARHQRAGVGPREKVNNENREPGIVEYDLPPGYPNEWVELAIYTHLPDSGRAGTLRSSRNHINVLSADAIVALPGGEGTASEIWLATQYGVPIIAYGAHEPVATGVPLARSIEEVGSFLADKVSGL